MIADLVAPLCLALLLLSPARLHAAGVSVLIVDSSGQAVAEAVLSLTPREGAIPPLAPEPPKAVMDQWGKQFIPYVLPVRVGTLVSFPNRDNIKHHVYSFSPAKRFELKLYSSGAAQPVLFDKPGIVTLGCNIHDWMLAYIDVLETPYFTKTDAQGRGQIEHLPGGIYRAEIWHPRLLGAPETFARDVTLTDNRVAELRYSLPLKREQRRTPPRYDEDGGY